MRGCDGRGWLKFITIWLRLTEGTKRSKLGTSSLICNFTESICMGIKSSCPSFIHRNKRKKTEGHAGWLFLPIRQSFPCSHLNHPPTTKSVSHLSFLLTHFMYPCNSVRMWLSVCVPMCVYVWLGRLILSARKCPAARIWSWESVHCSVYMRHGAKTGMKPLPISMEHSHSNAKDWSGVLRKSPYCQKQVWDAAKKNPPKLPKTLLIHNHINLVINTKNVSEENENLPVLCVFCSLLANNYWKLVKKLRNTMSWPKQNYPHASTVNKRLEEHASGFDVFSPEIFGFFHICASCFRPVSIFCNPLLLCSRLTAYCW